MHRGGKTVDDHEIEGDFALRDNNIEEKKYADYYRIRSILPEGIVNAVLKKATGIPQQQYHSMPLFQNSPDWIWRGFIHFLLPFQAHRSVFTGERRLVFFQIFYGALIWLALFILTLWVKTILLFLWLFIIVRFSVPIILAFVCLNRNKEYYKNM